MAEIENPRRLIMCCDGTGNEIKENQSNVLKFYRCLKKDLPNQIAFYDTGIGTISNSDRWSVFKSKAKGVFGLVTGYGLDDNVMDAYRFLIDHHQKGDEIYLFGFSRGAYTVRVLAGMINLVGILSKNQRHLAEYAYTAYKQADQGRDQHGDQLEHFDIAWRVQEVLDTKRATIKLMGCWDTVSSVITPRSDKFYLLSLENLPQTTENPCVQNFRHALAVDERRRMFRVFPWKEAQLYKTNPFVTDENAELQSCEQVWFAGVHSDIGGGYPERDSGSAKYPLAWMIDEARSLDLKFRERMVKRLVHGDNPKNVESGSKRDYAAPCPTAKLHDSMNWAWKILEYIPKSKKYHDSPASRETAGVYLPRSEPRFIPTFAAVHQSVQERIAESNEYSPGNLPSPKQIE